MQPTKKQIASGVYRFIDGTWHKRCTGPGHDEPIYLPATSKYFYIQKSNNRQPNRVGRPLARCRLCSNWEKLKSPGLSGKVAITDARPIYHEAINRVGLNELARRTGINADALRRVDVGQASFVRKANFRLVLLELISMRRKNEYSISTEARRRALKRANPERCSGCGTQMDNYTLDCRVCDTRKRKRSPESRALERAAHSKRRAAQKLHKAAVSKKAAS